MNAADRELIRLTAQIYTERFRKWPEGDTGAMIKDSALAARWIMEETYNAGLKARLQNAQQEILFLRDKCQKLSIENQDLRFDQDNGKA